MMPAAWPRDDRSATRLLHVDPRCAALADHSIGELPRLLQAGDLLVVNDAATLPASLAGRTESGAAVEIRLAGEHGAGSWRAVLLGEGDWRTRTEERRPPPPVERGDVLRFAGLSATIAGIEPGAPGLVTLTFDRRGADLWRALYHAGRPVQYAHTAAPLALWQVQTAYAGRPWAAEAPSAGFPLTWDLLLDLRRRGVRTARVTHAAGLSSTGDLALDARLPLAERFEVTAEAVAAIAAASERGGRIIAAGTTVARALESAAVAGGGKLVASCGSTDLLLGPGRRPVVADGVLTGIHEQGTSHFMLLQSFAPGELLRRAMAHAEAQGYRSHEFGDAMLILGDSNDKDRAA